MKKGFTSNKKDINAQLKKAQDKYARQTGAKPSGPKNLSSTTQQALRTGGWANPSSGSELKNVDSGDQNQAIVASSDTFGTGVLLNAIGQGSDVNNRIGRKVIIKSVFLRGTVGPAPTSTGGCSFRIIVVYDRQTNASTPAITDILLNDDFRSPNNLANRERFVTLMDIVSPPQSMAGDYEIGVERYLRTNLEMNFNTGTTAVIGAISSGAIWMFAAQSGSLATANGVFRYQTRVRYVDN